MGKIEEFRPKDSEKITINLGFVDLGHIDLLVQEGFYSNRTDFIRGAIRNQLDRQNDAVKQSIARRHLDLGMRQYSRQELEAAQRGVLRPPRFRHHRPDPSPRRCAARHGDVARTARLTGNA